MVWIGSEETGGAISKRYRYSEQTGYLGPKKKPLPENKYIYERIQEYCYNHNYNGNPDSVSGDALQFARTTPSWVFTHLHRYGDFAYEKANYKMFSQIDTFRTNLAEFIATRQQTVDMITEKVQGLVRITRAIRRGNTRELKRMFGKRPKSKDFANRFLEYSFGWVPLVSDVYMMANELHEPPKETFETRGRVASSTSSWNTWAGSSAWNGSVDIVAKCRIKLQCRVKNSAQQFLRDYGVTDPALVAWEMMPYSFVVDWFYPVGSYLQHRSTFSGIEIVRSSVTMDYTSNWFGSQPSYGPGWSGATCSGILKIKERNYRGFSTNPPNPFLKDPISTDHFFLSLALLRQQFK